MTGEWLTRMCWLLAVTAAGARGQQSTIAIGLENAHLAPFATLAQAQETASRIYASIDVKLKWSSGSKTAIWICFDAGIPATVHPGALGYAVPYGKTGTRIHVMIDRLADKGSRRLEGALLGHVMAHELGHVLEGFSRHSDRGVMKGQWNAAEFHQMLVGNLEFMPDDAELIGAGVERLERSRAPNSVSRR